MLTIKRTGLFLVYVSLYHIGGSWALSQSDLEFIGHGAGELSWNSFTSLLIYFFLVLLLAFLTLWFTEVQPSFAPKKGEILIEILDEKDETPTKPIDFLRPHPDLELEENSGEKKIKSKSQV